jgi:putative lipase involved disintegration of autophagic bodies
VGGGGGGGGGSILLNCQGFAMRSRDARKQKIAEDILTSLPPSRVHQHLKTICYSKSFVTIRLCGRTSVKEKKVLLTIDS